MMIQQIQKDYIEAIKSRNESAKLALGNLKAKITEAEKANGNNPISEADITKIVIKLVNQRNESIKFYEDAKRTDLADKEKAELEVLKKYMPKEMTQDEMMLVVQKIVAELKEVSPNLPQNALIGKTMGQFNKTYPGAVDSNTLKDYINKFVNG